MTRFDFLFTFLDTRYTAGCLVIPPSTNTQYHVFLPPPIREQFGAPIIFSMTEPWHFSFPSSTPSEDPHGPVLISSLWDGLRAFLIDNPKYLLPSTLPNPGT
jgi:hypothetical protein